jgi:hypothetical protein
MCSKNCAVGGYERITSRFGNSLSSVVILSEAKKPMHSEAVPRVVLEWLAQRNEHTTDVELYWAAPRAS